MWIICGFIRQVQNHAGVMTVPDTSEDDLTGMMWIVSSIRYIPYGCWVVWIVHRLNYCKSDKSISVSKKHAAQHDGDSGEQSENAGKHRPSLSAAFMLHGGFIISVVLLCASREEMY